MESPLSLLHLAAQRADAIFARLIGSHEFSARKFVVLTAIGRHPHCTQRQVVEATGIDRSTVSLMIRLLANKGLVAQIVNPRDQRSDAIVLTTEGKSALERASAAFDQAQAALLEALSERDRADFLNGLSSIISARTGDQPKRSTTKPHRSRSKRIRRKRTRAHLSRVEGPT